MKVLHVISDTNIGGAGILLCTLLKHFDRTRVTSIVALPKGSVLTARIRALSIPTVELSMSPDRFSIYAVKELSSLIKREGIEIVHANAAICARIAGKLCGTAVVHTRHCCFPIERSYWTLPVRTAKAIMNRILSDRVIATAEAAADNLRVLGIPKKKIELVINGSDPIRSVSKEEKDAFAAYWSIPKKAFVIGMSARLVECKGHEILLRAVRKSLDRIPHQPLCILFAGEGPHRAYLEALNRSLGLNRIVRFLGFLDDTAPFYRTIDLNVNCSTGTETSCLALSEGMSAGVPMIVSNFGGNRAMIGDSNAGIVFSPGDVEGLSNIICRLSSDRELVKRMQAEALHRYRSHYTASNMTEKVERIYEQLCH